jgi:MFS family permease
MYQVESSRTVLEASGAGGVLRRWRGVSITVIMLGLTSLLTDVSAEMVSTILPVYMLSVLRMSPLQVGLIDGLYQGAAVLVRLLSGLVADRFQRPRDVALAGYGLGAISKLMLLFSGAMTGLVSAAWSAIVPAIIIDRIGKGIRTSPRDAMITAATPEPQLGAAFGVHRAMDTAGAMIGPLLAWAILSLTAGAYDSVFAVSFAFAILGVSVLALRVHNPQTALASPGSIPGATLRAALGLWRAPAFRTLSIVSAVLALFTLSDAMLYLNVQQRLELPPAVVPLLFAGSALVYMVLSLPMGRLADKVGRLRIFVAGYALLALAYVTLLLPMGPLPIWLQATVYVALLGLHYSMTDGVLMAQAGRLIPAHLRTSGIALLTSGIGLARLAGSTLFGAVWSLYGYQTALTAFVAALCVALLLAVVALQRSRQADIGQQAGQGE